MYQEKASNAPKYIGGAVALVMLVALVFLYFADQTKTSSSLSSTTGASQASTSPTTTTTAATSAATAFKDGTYTATASYSVPHDQNDITVKLTVKDNVITAVTTDNTYGDHESARYVNDFESEISGVVVGKKLNEAKVSSVSGASDTSQGFNDALQTIISQAQTS